MKRWLGGIGLVGLLGLAAVGGLVAVPDAPVAAKAPAKVVVIPLREKIDQPLLFVLRRGLKEAVRQGADTVVLDMDTKGGLLETTYQMLEALGRFPGRTVTYVNGEALSAGALIAAGTDEIHFAPAALIGAAAPVDGSGADIDSTMEAKIVSYLKAKVRAMSEGKGYRGQVVSAMIDKDCEFKLGDEVINPKGELLTLTATEAMRTYGEPPQPLLGSGISTRLEDLLDKLYGAGNFSVTRVVDVSWSERLAHVLTGLSPLLVAAGLLCWFIEFKTPGMGIFGVAGAVLLGLVFFGQFTAGLSGHEPVLFFVLGMALLVVELFFFPGTAALAVAGVALMLGSLVWSMADLWPQDPVTFSSAVFLRPMIKVLGGVILAVVAFVALIRLLPAGGPWSRLVLHAAVGGEPAGLPVLGSGGSPHSGIDELIGMSGLAATALMPSGQVEIAGRRFEARMEMGFADAGVPVRVIGRAEFGLIVERVLS